MLPKTFLAVAICLQLLLVAESRRGNGRKRSRQQLFKQLVFRDHSNDDAVDMNAQELLVRSGFAYEEHYSVADDGYITLLLRIVNPLARQLRGPPVMLYHGAHIDSTIYLVSSSIQHRPEPWPRPPGYVPVSSSRSLGFMLANNGFDVWLVGTRGSNELNQGFTSNVLGARRPGFRPGQAEFRLVRENRDQYWSYGLDDIIQYEIREQINTVMRVTRHPEVSIFSFSLSTPTTMAFLAQHPDYARRVRVYFQMAPTINVDHFTFIDRIYFDRVCPKLTGYGNEAIPSYGGRALMRKVLLKASKSDTLRYSVVHRLLTGLFGPSVKYESNLERNLLAHSFQPVSFKSVQQYCQGSRTKRLSQFDYGREGNLDHYGQNGPPAYDIRWIEVQNWVVISGSYDGLADPKSVAKLVETSRAPRPVRHIIAPGFNHLDFLASMENDKYVNYPTLDILAATAAEYAVQHGGVPRIGGYHR